MSTQNVEGGKPFLNVSVEEGWSVISTPSLLGEENHVAVQESAEKKIEIH